MAFRLKIEGNDLVIFEDGAPETEYISNPAGFTVVKFPDSTNVEFYDYSQKRDGSRDTFLLGEENNSFVITDLIDDSSGSTFASVSAFKTFIRPKISFFSSTMGGSNFIPTNEKGAVNGVATLDSTGNVPLSQLGNIPEKEEFLFDRVETISNSSATPVEYFTTVQGGTEITTDFNPTGGDYEITGIAICTNTSTNGRLKLQLQISGVSVYSQDFVKEPKDVNDRIYAPFNHPNIAITAGTKTLQLNLSNDGSGTSVTYEAHISIKKKQ